MTVEIILDANFILIPHKKKIDIFSRIPELLPEKHDFVTLGSVVNELEGIAEGASDDAAAARTALKLIKVKGVKVVPSSGPADHAIVDYASRREKTVVCTNDKELKRKLKAAGVKTVSLHGEDKLITC